MHIIDLWGRRGLERNATDVPLSAGLFGQRSADGPQQGPLSQAAYVARFSGVHGLEKLPAVKKGQGTRRSHRMFSSEIRTLTLPHPSRAGQWFVLMPHA